MPTKKMNRRKFNFTQTKMSFCKFPSIEQFRHIVRDVTNTCRYKGKNKRGENIFDKSVPLPTLTFTGTVKLHGTNAAVGYNFASGKIWAQSRNCILSAASTNCGFWTFVDANTDALARLCSMVPHVDTDSVLLYGEWIGNGIQRGVAICELSRRFVLFAAKLVHSDKSEEWVADSLLATLKDHDLHVYNVHDYQNWTIDIDFENPDAASERMDAITLNVERECPVAKAFGKSGVGEGVVWASLTPEYGLLRFKVKGEKHRVTKSKKGAASRVEASADVVDFVRKTVTENRLEQALHEVFGDDAPSMAKTGAFIEWMRNDIFKEESDTLQASNLTQKDVVKPLSDAARLWLKKKAL